MAHKTFSQEQFQFQFYNLVISFTIPYPQNFKPLNINQTLFLILSLQANIPFVETNFFLLKRFQLSFPSSDQLFLIL